MIVSKKCLICGKEFYVPHWRKDSAKYCSVECQRKSLKAEPNIVCPICGKSFHRKASHINKFKGNYGFCCSKKCNIELRRIKMSGAGNHQYGLKGSLNSSFIQGKLKGKNNNIVDSLVYIGDWYKGYNENGRITEHRYLVELNHKLFNSDAFEEKDGWYYLKKGYMVHHKDCNHSNNDITNLQVLTKEEHVRLHNLMKPRNRNNKGQFSKNINYAVK